MGLFGRKKETEKKTGSESAAKSGGKDYAALLAKELGISAEEAARKLDYAKDNFGIPPRQYYKKKYYERTETAMVRKFLSDRKQKLKHSEMFEIIESLCGKDEGRVLKERNMIREMYPDIPVWLKWYFEYGLYDFDPESDRSEIDKIVKTKLRMDALKAEIDREFARIDRGEQTYEAIADKLDKYRELTGSIISEGKKIQLSKITDIIAPDAEGEELDRIKTDILMTDRLLLFFPDEYLVFDFLHKDMPERRTYISSKQRFIVVKALNSEEGFDLLDSKYDSYVRLAPLYGREIALIDSEGGFDAFRDYCATHEVFVKKNNYDSLGRGVEKVDLRDGTPLEKIYEEITEDGRMIELEDLIDPSEEIRSLNPDSVNTVRIIVFCDNGNAVVQDTFMKIGRAGSFVDNGGAGGIFVHVNKDTGVFDSAGIDENGSIYVDHPDHGYRFEGYALPEWGDALETAKAASLRVPEAKYIGWDLTQKKDGKWIIVEGNSKTQFFAQQMTTGRGVKREFLDAVGFSMEALNGDDADD